MRLDTLVVMRRGGSRATAFGLIRSSSAPRPHARSLGTSSDSDEPTPRRPRTPDLLGRSHTAAIECCRTCCFPARDRRGPGGSGWRGPDRARFLAAPSDPALCADGLKEAPQRPAGDVIGEREADGGRVAVVKASPDAGVGDVASQVAGARVRARDGRIVRECRQRSRAGSRRCGACPGQTSTCRLRRLIGRCVLPGIRDGWVL